MLFNLCKSLSKSLWLISIFSRTEMESGNSLKKKKKDKKPMMLQTVFLLQLEGIFHQACSAIVTSRRSGLVILLSLQGVLQAFTKKLRQ